jgi:hypothetical protein
MYNYFVNKITIIFWIDQSLFFHLHITFNIRYAIGLELLAVMYKCCTFRYLRNEFCY